MSEAKYTRPAEIELELLDGKIALRFCNSQVAQWEEKLGELEEWEGNKGPTLTEEITALIESCASDLAESIVYDFKKRVLADAH